LFANVPGGFAVGGVASTATVACGRMLRARGGEEPVPLGLPRKVSASVLPKMAQINCVVVAGHLLLHCITVIHQRYSPSERAHPHYFSPSHGTIAAHSHLIVKVN